MTFSLTRQAILLLLLPSAALGFLLPSQRQQPSVIHQSQQRQRQQTNNVPHLSWQNEANYCSSSRSTSLSMAFETNQESNIFDGPMSLTKERDACGVGFIANTQSGGQFCVKFVFTGRYCWDSPFICVAKMPMLADFICHGLYTILTELMSFLVLYRRIWYPSSNPTRIVSAHMHGTSWCLRRRLNFGRRSWCHDTNPMEIVRGIS